MRPSRLGYQLHRTWSDGFATKKPVMPVRFQGGLAVTGLFITIAFNRLIGPSSNDGYSAWARNQLMAVDS